MIPRELQRIVNEAIARGLPYEVIEDGYETELRVGKHVYNLSDQVHGNGEFIVARYDLPDLA